MRSSAVVLLAIAIVPVLCARADAQDAPPRIGPFVVDVRGTVPQFSNDLALAQSRGLTQFELPGIGLGVAAGAHLYPLKWRAITFGIGGELAMARSHSTPPDAEQNLRRAVTERFTSIAPQLSFNFGSGNGWSYISGGIGPSIRSIVPDGQQPKPADEERLRTINYGAGARWFAKKHLAFNFDVRVYAIDPGTPQAGFPGSPPATLLIMGAGVSVK